MKVQIVVTHLLGSGHLARALNIAHAFNAAGHTAQVVSGGFPVHHLNNQDVHIVQLPALRSNGTDFTTLLSASGAVATAADFDDRLSQLIAAFDRFSPDVLITELFPFGRRVLRNEFLALLKHAKSRAVCLSSVRDILAPPSKPQKAIWAADVLKAHYTGVLVHSDQDLIPLDLSWPITSETAPLLHYTGFVTQPLPPPSDLARDEILVSAGGGSVGDALFQAAIGASKTDKRTWRILVGGQNADARITKLRRLQGAALIEPARPDFRALLQGAAASISLCGYNTCMDILQSSVPAVFVPFDEDGETEQGLRAQTLNGLPGLRVLPMGGLTARTLQGELSDVLKDAKRLPISSSDGAEKTVTIVERIFQAKQ